MSQQSLARRFGDFEAHEQIEFKQTIFSIQLISLAVLGVVALAVKAIEFWVPNFFNYPYAIWNTSIAILGYFWPLFVYAGVLAILTAFNLMRSARDGEILFWDSVTSVLAGIWEELGYRCFFICFAMISIVVSNWLFSIGLGLGIVLTIVGIATIRKTHFFSILIFAIAALAFYWATITDPLYWFYHVIVLPVASFFTMGYMSSIFYGTHQPLFIMGAIAANGWFRDGHKYQGLVGYINSWYVGCVMMYAAFTYGLTTAIILHAIYNLEIGVIRFAARKLQR